MPTASRVTTSVPLWSQLSGTFSATVDCFAAYLALEGAEVVEGAKPGNLVNLVNRERVCSLNPYRLWQAHGEALLQGSGLKSMIMVDRGDSQLIYLYRDDLLKSQLKRKSVQIILQRQGYEQAADADAALRQLAGRMTGRDFPHEVGIFLGYPLKDVLAFMGHVRLAFTCQGPWKIFGDPAASLALAETYRECRRRMACRLSECSDPSRCLRLLSAA